MSLVRRTTALVASLAIAVSTAIIGVAPANAATCGEYKIVFQGAITGPYAQTGIGEWNGLRLAIRKYNAAKPKVKIKAAYIDTQASGDQSPALAQQMVNDACVLGIVGGMYSGETAAALPIYLAAGLPVISPSATRVNLPDVGGDVFHRIVANDDVQGPAMAKLALKTANAKVFVVDDQTAYGLGLAQIIRKKLGKSKVGDDSVTEGTTNFSSVVTKVKKAKANVVVYAGYYPEAAKFIKQLRDNPATKNVTFVSGDGVLDLEYIKLAKKYAEGTLMTAPSLDMAAADPKLTAEYKSAFGSAPRIYTLEAYNATLFFLEGVKKGNTTRAKLLNFINKSTVQGVGYKMKFTSRGEPSTKNMFAWTIKNGKIVGLGKI
jgi:branched-chain amino acid transport system substrate-binding protein